jgi:hypothetical protein
MDLSEERKKLYTEFEWAEIQQILKDTGSCLDTAIEIWGLSNGSPNGDVQFIEVDPESTPPPANSKLV